MCEVFKIVCIMIVIENLIVSIKMSEPNKTFIEKEDEEKKFGNS